MSDAKCDLCGEPMPPGEEMFKFHGYSGPCPKPPLPPESEMPCDVEWLKRVGLYGTHDDLPWPRITVTGMAGVLDSADVWMLDLKTRGQARHFAAAFGIRLAEPTKGDA